MIMKFIAGAFVLVSALVAPACGECDGVLADSTVTNLDFYQANVTSNTLHLPGGELRYNSVGIAYDEPLDLVVTVSSGDYTDILDAWIDREKDVPLNGINSGGFGKINLQTVQGKPKSGEANLKMCWVKEGTNEHVTVSQFAWTIYDLDMRGNSNHTLDRRQQEKFIMDTTQAKVFQLWPNEQESDVRMSCEDGSPTPCSGGVRTIFHSSIGGTGGDNPSHPGNLTELQRKRSVAFTFQNTDCWIFTYDHYCPVDQDDYQGSETSCRSYGGGFFFFAGGSEAMINDGECLTPSPTTSAAPSSNPTPSPSTSPSSMPTPSPSTSPTLNPTKNPTTSPTKNPTKNPTTSPTFHPTNVPTEETCDVAIDLTNLGEGYSEAWGPNAYSGQCYPHVTVLDANNMNGFDDGIAVFVGGDYIGVHAAEVEGRMVVLGDLTVQADGPGNFVSAGAGTHVIPNNGVDCIIVGGDIAAYRDIQVLNQKPWWNCNIIYRGNEYDSQRFFTNGDILHQPGYDVTHFEQMRYIWHRKSQYWKTLPSTGSVVHENWGNPQGQTTYACNSNNEIQVFNIHPGDYKSINAVHTIYFSDECEDKTILINVHGCGDVEFDAAAMWHKGKFGWWVGGFDTCLTGSILWNFPDAENVDLGSGKTSEFHGSVLVAGNLKMTTSGHSGRTIVLGDLEHNAPGHGSEFHSYQFNPPMDLPDPPVDFCELPSDLSVETDCAPSHSPTSAPSTMPTSVPTAAPSPCGCPLCTDEVLDRYAGFYKCGARINWVINNWGMTEAEACALVAGDEFFDVCGECDSNTCNATDSPSSSPSVASSVSPSSVPSVTPTKNPTKAPTASPTVSPTFHPTNVPSVAPSGGPNAAPSSTPSVIPTKNPTKVPTATPTVSPSDVPSEVPSVEPTISPSVIPSIAPTSDPTVSPSNVPSTNPTETPWVPCPEDVTLLSMTGKTPINLEQAVQILSQDVTSVTVRLFQSWTSSGCPVDNIFYTYKTDPFKEQCFEQENVEGSSDYDDITIQCYHTSPNALLQICIADTGGALDSVEDTAEVPECCHPEIPSECPVVCYKIIIKCDSVCVDAVERRALRGSV